MMMPKKIDIDGTVRSYQRVPPLALGKAFLGIPLPMSRRRSRSAPWVGSASFHDHGHFRHAAS
jgi:hypothetical protein